MTPKTSPYETAAALWVLFLVGLGVYAVIFELLGW
jgi:hypothetical protein